MLLGHQCKFLATLARNSQAAIEQYTFITTIKDIEKEQPFRHALVDMPFLSENFEPCLPH